MKLRLPANYYRFDDLLTMEAGQAYLLNQLDRTSCALPPEHAFHSSRTNCDPSRYEIYDDGSLWFVNNAQDEVWADYRDFVRDCLIPGINSQPSELCWTEDEYESAESLDAWLIDDMDKQLLILFCDGDEPAARELCGVRVAR